MWVTNDKWVSLSVNAGEIVHMQISYITFSTDFRCHKQSCKNDKRLCKTLRLTHRESLF